MAPFGDVGNNSNSNSTKTDTNERNQFYLVWGSVLALVAIIIAIVSNKRFQTRVYNSMTKVVLGIGCTLGKARVRIEGLILKVFHAVSNFFRHPQQRLRSEGAQTPAIKLRKIGHKKDSKGPPASPASPAVIATKAVGGDPELGETRKKQEATSSTSGSEDITDCRFGIVASSVAGGNAGENNRWDSATVNAVLAEQDLSVREASDDYVRQGLVV